MEVCKTFTDDCMKYLHLHQLTDTLDYALIRVRFIPVKQRDVTI